MFDRYLRRYRFSVTQVCPFACPFNKNMHLMEDIHGRDRSGTFVLEDCHSGFGVLKPSYFLTSLCWALPWWLTEGRNWDSKRDKDSCCKVCVHNGRNEEKKYAPHSKAPEHNWENEINIANTIVTIKLKLLNKCENEELHKKQNFGKFFSMRSVLVKSSLTELK